MSLVQFQLVPLNNQALAEMQVLFLLLRCGNEVRSLTDLWSSALPAELWENSIFVVNELIQ